MTSGAHSPGADLAKKCHIGTLTGLFFLLSLKKQVRRSSLLPERAPRLPAPPRPSRRACLPCPRRHSRTPSWIRRYSSPSSLPCTRFIEIRPIRLLLLVRRDPSYDCYCRHVPVYLLLLVRRANLVTARCARPPGRMSGLGSTRTSSPPANSAKCARLWGSDCSAFFLIPLHDAVTAPGASTEKAEAMHRREHQATMTSPTT